MAKSSVNWTRHAKLNPKTGFVAGLEAVFVVDTIYRSIDGHEQLKERRVYADEQGAKAYITKEKKHIKNLFDYMRARARIAPAAWSMRIVAPDGTKYNADVVDAYIRGYWSHNGPVTSVHIIK